MSKTTAPADAGAASEIVAIALKEPHTHAGRDYPAGATLTLADIDMSQTDAAWLIGVGVAVRA